MDRIDANDDSLPLDGTYTFEYSGAGVDVFLLDTGLYQQHNEFAAQLHDATVPREVKCGYDAFVAPEEEHVGSFFGKCVDRNGHGTHVAGILGGTEHGVSKDANLISVKVFDADHSGSLATVLAGLDFVLKQKKTFPTKPMVANISLGGPRSELITAAVEAVADAGVVVVASAGNEAKSSCTKAPASSSKVITVSATNYQDAKPAYANSGPCLTIFAPGHQITSAWIRNKGDTARLSGTSMASAHVAGGTCSFSVYAIMVFWLLLTPE